MLDKLISRKLWVLIGIVALIVANYVFGLGMPPQDVLYLVIIGASYILGQGYVDAKQQPVKDFPVADITQSFMNIIQAELSKTGFGKNLPMEDILDMLKTLMRQEFGKLSFTVTTPADQEPVQPVAPAPQTDIQAPTA
ncbi:MAG: hypothetical protein ACYCVD_02730 [Desulfitobacteriaceae bacterium]